MSQEGLSHIVGKEQQTEKKELGELSDAPHTLRRSTIPLPLRNLSQQELVVPREGTQLMDEIGGADVLERFLRLPRLSETLSLTDENEMLRQLQERYEELGKATLHPESILRLREEFKKNVLENFTLYLLKPHNSTFKAESKEVMLGPDEHVQKSVTVRTHREDSKILIVTSIGNHIITKETKREIAERLDLHHRELKYSTINPEDLHAEDFGLREGMLSPFLPPGFEEKVYAFIHLPWAPVWNKKGSAVISFSPFESVKMPLDKYRKILEGYFEGRDVRLVFL